MANYDGDITLTVDLEPGDITSTAEELQKKISELSGNKMPDKLAKSFVKVQTSMAEAGTEASKLLKEVKKLETVKVSPAYSALETQLDTLKDKHQQLTQQIERAKLQRGLAKDAREQMRTQDPKNYKQSEKYADLSKWMDRERKRAERYSAQLKEVDGTIKTVTSQMQAMKQAGTDTYTETNTQHYQELIQQLNELNNALTTYISIVARAQKYTDVGPNTTKWQSFMAVLGETNPMLANLGSILGDVAQEIAFDAQDIGEAYKEALTSVVSESTTVADKNIRPAFETTREVISSLAPVIIRVFSLLGNLGPVLRTLASKLMQVASAAAKAATNLVKMVGSSVAKGIRTLTGHLGKLVSSLKKTNKSTDSASDAFRKGLKTLIKYTFGVRSFFFLWRKMRKALSEGIGNLAQYSAPFNDIISDFISALTRLKNSFATAFAPIMNVVVPILTTFINVISDVVTKIGMLIAALTGKTTFIRAKAVQEDYAASLDKAAGSASDAAKANKEYEKTIAGFDDVEILKDPTKNASGSGGSGGSGGAGSVSPEDMFETVNIPAAFHNWAEMIKKAWQDANFTEIGDILGQKIANILNNLPWEDIQKNASNFAKSFATFFNGLLESKITLDDGTVITLGDAIGTSIGEVINTGISFLQTLTDTIHFDSIGSFIADGMNKMTITVNWDGIATTLSNAANGVFDAAATWSGKFNFSALATAIKDTAVKALNGITWDNAETAATNIGKGFADALNVFFTADMFDSISTALGNAVNTAITGGYTFIGRIEWAQWGETIKNGIVNFFGNIIDWKKIGLTAETLATGLGTIVKSTFETAYTLIGRIEWKEWGNTIKNSITNFFGSIGWETYGVTKNTIASALAKALNTIFETANTLIGRIEWEEWGKTIKNAINNFFDDLDWKTIGVTAETIATALAKTINTLFEGAYTLLGRIEWKEWGVTVGNAINNFFSTIKWESIGLTFGEAAAGIADFIKNAIEKIDFETVGAGVVDAFKAVPWDTLFTKAGELVEAGAKALEDFLNGLLKNLGQALIDWFNNNVPQEIKDFVNGVVEAYKAITGGDEGAGVPTTGSTGRLYGAGTIREGYDPTVNVTLNATGMTDNIPPEQKDVNGELSATKFNDKMAAQQKVVNNIIGNLTNLNKNTVPASEKIVSGISAYIKAYSEAKDVTGKSPSDFWASVSRYLEAPGITGKSPENFIAWIKTFKEQQGATGKETTGVSAGISKFFEQPKATGKSTNGYSAGVSSFSEEDKATGKTSKGWKAVASKLTDSIAKKNKVIKNATVKATDLNTKSVDGDTVNVTAKATDLNTNKVDGDYVDVTAKVTQLEGLRSKIIDIFEGFGLKVGKETGGAYYSGSWHGIAQYATGGIPTHGTVFVAGEAGAEAVGHIGNRTEVLNQSQMAAVMYSAVLNGTASLVKTITNYMALCTNTLITNIGTIISQAGYISSQLAELHNLGNVLTTTLTDIVVGKIIPSTYTNNANNNTLNKILDVLQYNQSNMVTRDELEVVLRTSFERYMNIGFYIGDEQIARHANAGNAKLNYRFSPVR